MSARRITFYMHDLSGGGVERMRLTLIAELRDRGVDVELVVNCKRGPLLCLLPGDLRVHELGTQRTLKAVKPLARYLRRARPDVLISSLDHNNITALLAGLVSRVRVSVVICQHNALSAERTTGWRYRLIPWLYWLMQGSARGIIAVSHGLAKDLAETAGIPARRITTIYNPVVNTGFMARASGPPPHAWLEDRSCPVFVFAGRLTHQKDPMTLLHALALVLAVCPARLIVLGEGPLRGELVARASELGIGDSVAFVDFQTNPLPWIRHADALVSTSRYEGLGNTIVEALACGTPVIATDCPHGPSEILLGGEIGSLVPVADCAALALAMQAQIDAPRDTKRLLARAELFTSKACADAHLSMIDGFEAKSIRAFGLCFSPLRADEVIDRVVTGATEKGVRLVVTPNLDHIRLLRDRTFAAAYEHACFVCPDGFPVLLYARLRGLRLSARVTGCELVHRLFTHPDLARHRLCVVVESERTASGLLAWAANACLLPNTTVMVAAAGLAHAAETQLELAIQIQQAEPTILILTLGAPLSEHFVNHHRDLLGSCWALCVGQAVRVELGLTQRAPVSWRLLGLEWLWRIRQEPRRLAGRYLRAAASFPTAVFRDLGRTQLRVDHRYSEAGTPASAKAEACLAASSDSSNWSISS